MIVLKDFPGREVTALIDFMYRGEIRVGREELPGLMRAAESLQVRGLASSEPRPASPPDTPTTVDHHLLLNNKSDLWDRTDATTRQSSVSSPTAAAVDDDEALMEDDPTQFRNCSMERLPHMGHHHLNFSLRELRDSCGSPLMPRRKQARPRRRSGELVPQDLSNRPHPPPSSPSPVKFCDKTEQQANDEQAENLSMKRSLPPSSPSIIAGDHNSQEDKRIKTESESASSPRGSPFTTSEANYQQQQHQQEVPIDTPTAITAMSSALSLTPPHHHSEYLTSLNQLAAQWLPPPPHHHHPREGSPRHYQQQDSIRRPPPFPPMDVFPHGGSLLDLHDSFKPDASLHGLFAGAALGGHHHHGGGGLTTSSTKKSKKHHRNEERRWSSHDHARGLPVGRPKGQHSAPRGGPPRSWTNAELTEALQHVWNKKMTTSQASRIFGIPYNSLLMYVRGKYGKSLKLEQLRRDCTGGEVMTLNNNVKSSSVQQTQQQPQVPGHLTMGGGGGGLPPLGGSDEFHHPFGGLPGYFADLSFPVPVNIAHLIPPSEQQKFDIDVGHQSDLAMVEDIRQHQRSSRSPSPIVAVQNNNNNNNDSPLLVQPSPTAAALLQQNGSD